MTLLVQKVSEVRVPCRTLHRQASIQPELQFHGSIHLFFARAASGPACSCIKSSPEINLTRIEVPGHCSVNTFEWDFVPVKIYRYYINVECFSLLLFYVFIIFIAFLNVFYYI